MSLSEKMQEKRNKIKQVALELFAQQGYINTPVRDIIEQSGFGTGTFYNYFNNKEDVLKSLLVDFMDEILTAVHDYYNIEEDLYKRFIESKRVVIEVFARNEALAEIYSRVAGISENIDHCFQEFEHRFLLFSTRNIQYGIEKKVFKDVPVEPVANAILAIMKYAVYKWIVLKEISQVEMMDMVISFHDTLALGLIREDPGSERYPG